MDKGYQVVIVNVLKSEGFRKIEGYGEIEDAYLVDSFIIEAPWQTWQNFKLELVLSDPSKVKRRALSDWYFAYVSGHEIKDFAKNFWERSNLIFNKPLIFDLFFQERKFLKKWKNVIISGTTQNMDAFDIKIVRKNKKKTTRKSVLFDVLEAEQSPFRTYVTFRALKFAKFIVVIEIVNFWKMKEILEEKRKELAEKAKILWKYLEAEIEEQIKGIEELMEKRWKLREKIKDLEMKAKILESRGIDEIVKFTRGTLLRLADKIGAKEVHSFLIIGPYEDLNDYTIKTISPFLILGKENDFKTYNFLVLLKGYKIYGKPWSSEKLYQLYEQSIKSYEFIIVVGDKNFDIIQKGPFWILGKAVDFIIYKIKVEEKHV